MREFSFPISGKGITKPNLAKYLNTHLQCKITKLSVPYELNAPTVVKVVFLVPLDVASKFDTLFVGNQLDFSQVRRSWDDVKKNNKTLQFQNGAVDVSAKGGVLTISKLSFTDGDPMTSLDMTGTEMIATDAIDLYTIVHVPKFILPVPIGGTLSKPDIDYTRMTVDAGKENALNILNPENLTNGTASDLTKKVLDVGKKLEGFLGK